jgi:hypothetical protein
MFLVFRKEMHSFHIILSFDFAVNNILCKLPHDSLLIIGPELVVHHHYATSVSLRGEKQKSLLSRNIGVLNRTEYENGGIV